MDMTIIGLELYRLDGTLFHMHDSADVPTLSIAESGTTSYFVFPITRSGLVDPIYLGVEIEAEFPDPDRVGGYANNFSAGRALGLYGGRIGQGSVRIGVTRGDTLLYRSPLIPVSVSAFSPPPIEAVDLRGPLSTDRSHHFGEDGAPPIRVTQGADMDTEAVVFVSASLPDGIPDSLLGPSSYLEVSVDPAGILNAGPVGGRPYRIGLWSRSSGEVRMTIALETGTRTLYRSPPAVVQVFPADATR
jgi:hypothetical protein